MERLAILFTFAAALGTTVAASAEMDANTLLNAYDAASPKEKIAIEKMVLTAETAFREASSAIVVQRNEYGLYCPPMTNLLAPNLIEMIRRAVSQDPFVGKYPFQVPLLHALQVTFPCPPQSK